MPMRRSDNSQGVNMLLQLCQRPGHDVDLHLHMLWLSHVSFLVLGYHVELLP